MANAGSLGALTLEIGADPSLLEAKLKEVERTNLKTAKKVEAAVQLHIEKAFKAAQRSIDASFAQQKAGGKVGEAAVIRNAKAIILWRNEVEKTRGSIDKATEREKQQYKELEAQLKRLREEAAKARPVPALAAPASPKAVSNKYDTSIGPAQPLSEIEVATKRANDALVEYQKKLQDTGNVGAADIKKLIVAQILHERAIVSTFGSLEAATPEAQENYKKIAASVDDAKREVIELGDEFNDQRETLNKYGAEWNGLFNAIEQRLGKRGVLLGQLGLGYAAVTEGWGIGSKINEALGGSTTGLQSLGSSTQRRGRPIMDRIGRGYAIQYELLEMLATSKFVSPRNVLDLYRNYYSAPTGSSLLQPLPNTQAFRLGLADYRRMEDPRLPTDTRLQHQKNIAQQNLGVIENAARANPAYYKNAFKEADRAYVEATRSLEAWSDAEDQRILQLQLEHAQMTNNKADVSSLSELLDGYVAREMERAGSSEAVINTARDQVRVNRELSFTLRDLTEELETLGLQQSNAEVDSQFDQQRQLTKQTADRTIRIAELTGKSKEYVAALRVQLEQQLRQIDINEIQRRQETVDLQMQVAQGRGFVDVQKRLATVSNQNAIAIAVKEKRTREYIEALVELGRIEQARLEMERIQQRMTLAGGELELLQMQDEIDGANAYGEAIERLTARIAQLNIERLEASADWTDHAMAGILRHKEEQRPLMQERQARLAMLDIERQITAHHITIREQMVRDELAGFAQTEQGFRAMVTQNVITKEQGDALIARSHDLLMGRLRDIDASYGRDWARWAERLAIKYEDEAARIGDAAERIADTAKTALADSLFVAITEGVDGAKAAFQDLGRAILREIMNIVASKAVASLLRIVAMMGGNAAATNAATMNATLGYAWANGGVAPGGFLPVRAFANGGTVSRPTLGLVGEGRYNEAIVPLPDGRSIPVAMTGSGASKQPINVVVEWSPEFISGIVKAGAAQGAAQASRYVIPIVADDLKNNGPLRKMIAASI